MTLRRTLLLSPWAALVLVSAWPMPAFAVPMTFSASGPNATSISATVAQFQAALGNPNNGNAAGTTGGRREINWDGGNVNLLDNTPGGTPFNVFLNTRGGQFTTSGTGFVQAPPSGGPQNGLAGQFSNATYGTTFAAFSPSRLFVPIGSNAFDALFFVPGTNGGVPATVGGFGIVFSDIDLANTTHMDFFDPQGNSLGSFNAAAGGTTNASFSFLGVNFSTEQIGRVHVVSATARSDRTTVRAWTSWPWTTSSFRSRELFRRPGCSRCSSWAAWFWGRLLDFGGGWACFSLDLS
jgi:hypothetical protein